MTALGWSDTDTIAAIATPPGYGGIGIIRLSGPASLSIMQKISRKARFKPRYATFATIYDDENQGLDSGLVLYFPGPHSYTGDEVVEWQGHGGQVVLEAILKCMISHGARYAEPGEFTQRAFLNQRLNLLQAEAICDLIHAQSLPAVKAAQASLCGSLTDQVQAIDADILQCRILVESFIDFAEDAVDTKQKQSIAETLTGIATKLTALLHQCERQRCWQHGATVALLGLPNAGKSSLFNALLGENRAIVTPQPGTTRDTLQGRLLLGGIPVELIDTAGLHQVDADQQDHTIEREGMKRSKQIAEQADIWLIVYDGSKQRPIWPDACPPELQDLALDRAIILIDNKIDVSGRSDQKQVHQWGHYIALSAQTESGITWLLDSLTEYVQGGHLAIEPTFSVRERHVKQLQQCLNTVDQALNHQKMTEFCDLALLAEDLKQAHADLAHLIGYTHHETVLNGIFSTFCLGK